MKTSSFTIQALMALCLTIFTCSSVYAGPPVTQEGWDAYHEYTRTLEQKVNEITILRDRTYTIRDKMNTLNSASTEYRSLSTELSNINSQLVSLNATASAYRAAGYGALIPRQAEPVGVWREVSLGTGYPGDPRNGLTERRFFPGEVETPAEVQTAKPATATASTTKSSVGPTNQAGRDALEAAGAMEKESHEISKNAKLIEAIFPGEFKTPKGYLLKSLTTAEDKRVYLINEFHSLQRDLSIFPDSKKVIAEFQKRNKNWLDRYSKVLVALQMEADSVAAAVKNPGRPKVSAVQALTEVDKDLGGSKQINLLKKWLKGTGSKALAGIGILGIGLSAANASEGEELATSSAIGSAKALQYRGTVPVTQEEPKPATPPGVAQ